MQLKFKLGEVIQTERRARDILRMLAQFDATIHPRGRTFVCYVAAGHKPMSVAKQLARTGEAFGLTNWKLVTIDDDGEELDNAEGA